VDRPSATPANIVEVAEAPHLATGIADGGLEIIYLHCSQMNFFRLGICA
jgi:hypothetical protein